jgi:hypothetical protein
MTGRKAQIRFFSSNFCEYPLVGNKTVDTAKIKADACFVIIAPELQRLSGVAFMLGTELRSTARPGIDLNQ